MDMAGLRESIGRHLGFTDWQEMTQERVDMFADATDDHQFIHVDPERAKATPFGGTIAHGYLTLSLVAPVMQQLLRVSDSTMGVNYGLDKVRFPAPLPVGAQFLRDHLDERVEPVGLPGPRPLVKPREVSGGPRVDVDLWLHRSEVGAGHRTAYPTALAKTRRPRGVGRSVLDSSHGGGENRARSRNGCFGSP